MANTSEKITLTEKELQRINQIFGELFTYFSENDKALTLKVLKILKGE